MENPATWGTLERLVGDVMSRAAKETQAGICGLSIPRQIADAIRKEYPDVDFNDSMGRRITDEINADPAEVSKLRQAMKEADEGKYSPRTQEERSPH